MSSRRGRPKRPHLRLNRQPAQPQGDGPAPGAAWAEGARAPHAELPAPARWTRLRDLWGKLQLGRHFRKLAPAVQRDIHELFTRSAGDLLDHWLETEAVKALFGFDAVVGNYASPYTPWQRPCAAAPRLWRGERQDGGVGGHAVGGMAAIAQAMLPKFTAASRHDNGAHLGSGIIIAPSLEYMDRAFADARLTGMSHATIVEMLIPSTLNTTLASRGAHVASVYCQRFAYKLPGGLDWHQERQRAVNLIFATVDSYAPNFRASVVGHSALSPSIPKKSSA